MKLNIQKEDLYSAVKAVARAVSSKNTLPILGGIMLSSSEDQPGKLWLRATDLELAMECVIDADIEEVGQIVVPGRYFLDLVSHLPAGNIALESKGYEELTLYYEKSQVCVRCFDPDEFPALPQAEGDICGQIPVATFRRMVKQVKIATASDEVRPLFTGILIELEADKLAMVASDTHRLALSLGGWQGTGQARLVLPSRTMNEIASLSVNEEGLIQITASQNQAYFQVDNITFVTRVISGQYPDYNQVLPATSLYNSHCIVHKGKLIEALERASLLARDTARGRANIVKLIWGQNILTLLAEAPDIGSIHEEIAVDLEGAELEASYNIRYLLEALKVIEEEQVVFHLTGENTPGVILPAGQELGASQYTYLVLPVRVSR